MKKKIHLGLENLKVKSFVTSLQEAESANLKGGTEMNCISNQNCQSLITPNCQVLTRPAVCAATSPIRCHTQLIQCHTNNPNICDFSRYPTNC